MICTGPCGAPLRRRPQALAQPKGQLALMAQRQQHDTRVIVDSTEVDSIALAGRPIAG